MNSSPPLKQRHIFSRIRLTRGAWPAAVCIASWLVGVASAQTVAVTYAFTEPVLGAGSAPYCTVGIDGCDTLQTAGQPQVPFRTGRILLPSGAVITKVISSLEAPVQIIDLDNPLAFGRTPVPIGLTAPPAAAQFSLDKPDPAIYTSDVPYPENRVQLLSIQRLHGYDVAVVRVYPAPYKPASGKLLFCPKIVVKIDVETPIRKVNTASSHVLSATQRDSVREFVDNPVAVAESGARTTTSAINLEAYDYLLVTRASLTNAFQPLVDQKVSDGLAVKVAIVDDILASTAGSDDAAKLRNYLAQAYANWGVSYVLLGGDVGTVPHRGAYAYCQGAEPAMPCDLYFACLDGSWNSDGDAYWGEPTDGEGGGDVDLVAEVYVGRAPVDTAEEASRFVEKTIRYERGGHNNAEKALFLGEYLGNYSGVEAHGGYGLDALLPSFTKFDVTWLDDRPTNAQTWDATKGMAALNTSPHLVASFGHANATYALRMDRSYLANTTNQDLFLLNGAGCLSGAFDYASGDCFAEELLKKNNCGAFAVIMNTRNGWFSASYESRFSIEFMQRFFDRLLVDGEVSIGKAHYRSKEEMLGRVERAGDMTYRWCYFTNTLFGDPHVPLQHDALNLLPEQGLLSTGYVGGPFTPAQRTYVLSNSSTGMLAWTSLQSADWVSVSPHDGFVASGMTTNVVITFTPRATVLLPGSYTDSVTFSNVVSGYGVDVPVSLSLYGNLSFASNSSSVMERRGAKIMLSVMRGSNTNRTATVDFATLEGTALAGQDYVATNGTLFFAVGEASRTIEIMVRDDDVAESDEQFQVVLSNPTGYATLESPSVVLATIHDNDWLDHFAWSEVGTAPRIGHPLDMTATAINRTGDPLTRFASTCALYAMHGIPFAYDVGEVSNAWDYPLACYKQDARTQVIYPAAEIGSSGLITGLSLYVYGIPSQPLNAWTIRLKHTPLGYYDESTRNWQTNDWVVAIQTNITITARGWNRFAFTTPFAYDGTNNLLVDFSFNNDKSSSPSGYCYGTDVTTNRSLFAKVDGGAGDPLQWSGRTPDNKIACLVPVIQLEKNKLLALTPSETTPFVAGVWSGRLAFLDEGTNIALHISDGAGHAGISEKFDVLDLNSLALAPSLWLSDYGLPSDGSALFIDSDGDGFENWAEWVSGTDPTNRLSLLTIESACPRDEDGRFRIRWQSVPGKRYRVESLDALSPSGTFIPFASDIPGEAATTEIIDWRPDTTGSRFYRIGVEP